MAELGTKKPSPEIMERYSNGFLKTKVWAIKGENEDLGIEGENLWSFIVVDLTDVSFIKVNEDPNHFAFGKAILYYDTGGSITINVDVNDAVYLWMEAKREN